jgi:hypothetical protein
MTLAAVSIFPILPSSIKQTMSSSDANSNVAEPSPKRARIEMPSFKDLNLEKLSLKDNGMKQKGNTKLVLPFIDGKKLQCNLTPSGFLKAPFGFDTSCKYEKPSFLMGTTAEKSEKLKLAFQLGPEEAEFFQGVNEFFKNKYAELDRKPLWYDSVKETDKFGVIGTVKVILDGLNQTQLKIVGADNQIRTGYGWSFLKEYMEESRNFRGARCKVIFGVTGLWCKGGQAGLNLDVSHLVLTPAEKGDDWGSWDEVFDDDALLKELNA